MKLTVQQLLECSRRGATPEEYANVILARVPGDPEQRRRYLGQLGMWVAAAMDGVVPDPATID